MCLRSMKQAIMVCQVGDESPPGSRGTAAPDALGAEDFAASGQGVPEEVPDQEPAAAPGITGKRRTDMSFPKPFSEGCGTPLQMAGKNIPFYSTRCSAEGQAQDVSECVKKSHHCDRVATGF
jgi:hypothetical protein